MKNARIFLTNFILVLFASALFTMNSCEKNDDPDPVTTQTDLLTSHVWNFNKFTTTSTNTEIKVLVSAMSVLMEGTTIKFNTSGSYVLSDGEEEDYGIWEFNVNETSIYFDLETDEFLIAPIIKLSGTEFEFKESVEGEAPENFNVIWHWVK